MNGGLFGTGLYLAGVLFGRLFRRGEGTKGPWPFWL